MRDGTLVKTVGTRRILMTEMIEHMRLRKKD